VAGEILYLDASALVKLVQVEPESHALTAEAARWRAHATSVVGMVETKRAARRVRADERRLEAVIARVALLELDEGVRQLAAELEPAELRTLDALHLASALSLEDDLGAFACYDARLAAAAAREGIGVLSPGW
jgi:predicted nucleic acid-binding protein